MAARPTLITLEPPAVYEVMLEDLATRTPEPSGPAGLLQSGLTLLIDSLKPLKLRQEGALLELDGTVRHSQSGICVPA